MTKRKIVYIIIALIITCVLVANYFYYENQKDDYLECTYNTKYSNYEETLLFRYLEGTLFRYTRSEIITTEDMDKDLKEYENIKKNAPNYAYFEYDIKHSTNKIYVTTKIEAFHTIDFYNDYIQERKITFADSIDEVKNKLESQDYTCKKYRK